MLTRLSLFCRIFIYFRWNVRKGSQRLKSRSCGFSYLRLLIKLLGLICMTFCRLVLSWRRVGWWDRNSLFECLVGLNFCWSYLKIEYIDIFRCHTRFRLHSKILLLIFEIELSKMLIVNWKKTESLWLKWIKLNFYNIINFWINYF